METFAIWLQSKPLNDILQWHLTFNSTGLTICYCIYQHSLPNQWTDSLLGLGYSRNETESWTGSVGHRTTLHWRQWRCGQKLCMVMKWITMTCTLKVNLDSVNWSPGTSWMVQSVHYFKQDKTVYSPCHVVLISFAIWLWQFELAIHFLQSYTVWYSHESAWII